MIYNDGIYTGKFIGKNRNGFTKGQTYTFKLTELPKSKGYEIHELNEDIYTQTASILNLENNLFTNIKRTDWGLICIILNSK